MYQSGLSANLGEPKDLEGSPLGTFLLLSRLKTHFIPLVKIVVVCTARFPTLRKPFKKISYLKSFRARSQVDDTIKQSKARTTKV